MKRGWIAGLGVLASLAAGARLVWPSELNFLRASDRKFAAMNYSQPAGAGGATSVADPVQLQANPAPSAIRVTSSLVTVSVIVRDKHGEPLTDLTKDDFVLLDDKKAQALQVFSMEKTAFTPPAETALPPDTYSNEIGLREGTPSNLTIILLDSLNTDFLKRPYPRNQVKKLLLTLEPGDRVALYALGTRLRVLHDFTGDSSSLLAALKNDKDNELQDIDVVQPPQANAVNHQMENLATDSGAVHSEQTAETRVAATAEAIRSIANHVSYLPGRKNLIWISAEFPFYLESNNIQRALDGKKLEYTTETELLVRALTNAQIAVYPIDARGLLGGGPADIAAKSLSAEEADMATIANMEILARRTGGLTYRDTNGIADSIRRTIDGSRVTYQLGFYPDNVRWDGSFHKIQVKVNRRDAHVEARDGYYALAEPSLTPKMVRGLIDQSAESEMDATGVRFDLHVAAVGAGENKLSLSLSFDPSQLGFAPHNGELKDAVDVAFIAKDSGHRALQTTVLPLPFEIDAETYENLVKTGFNITREVPMPANAAELRVIVYDEGNSKVGSLRVPLAGYLGKRPD